MKNLFFILFLLPLFAVVHAQPDSLQDAAFQPIKVKDFELKAADRNVQILWQVNNNEDVKGFEVERSDDGATFKKIGGKLSQTNTGAATYEFVDAMLKTNLTYQYRIKALGKDGEVVYSSPLSIELADQSIKYKLLQNPVRHQLSLELMAPSAGLAHAVIYTSGGIRKTVQAVQVRTGANMLQLSTQQLKAGLYRLVIDMGNERALISFVKQ